MSKVVYVKSLYRNQEEYLSKEIKISGWIRTLRASNAFGFIEVNDGTFFKNIQVVFDNQIENFKEVINKCKELGMEVHEESMPKELLII